MMKYMFALLTLFLMWRADETGNLKIICGAFASFVVYSILFFKELI
ncbi:MAG: hypothetical protein U0K91_07200 [Acutalibacteraceae bacterium]|nr:hypothetical protein [Acutalibacteraceae bacterium]